MCCNDTGPFEIDAFHFLIEVYPPRVVIRRGISSGVLCSVPKVITKFLSLKKGHKFLQIGEIISSGYEFQGIDVPAGELMVIDCSISSSYSV